MSYDACPPDDSGVIDMGHDVRIRYSHDGEGNRIGLIESHLAPGNTRCSGYVGFDVPAARPLHRPGQPLWRVLSTDPLTLDPSLLCSVCGHHGFIRDGRWVPA